MNKKKNVFLYVVLALIALFLIIGGILSSSVKTWIYNSNAPQIILQVIIGIITLILIGRTIESDDKTKWIEEIIALVIELIVYWGIVYTDLPVSTWIMHPFSWCAIIGGIYIFIKLYKK